MVSWLVWALIAVLVALLYFTYKNNKEYIMSVYNFSKNASSTMVTNATKDKGPKKK